MEQNKKFVKEIAKKIASSASEFLKKLQENDNDRYKSWEHCYIFFHSKRGQQLNAGDYDQLSLHLAFYLASWGMYRGSSFLLQRDYRIHLQAVKEIMKAEYDELFGVKCCDLAGEEGSKGHKKRMKIWSLYNKLKEIYDPIRHQVYEERPVLDDCENKGVENELSATLITKIMMGTLGCIPAYDRYFIEGIKHKFKFDGGKVLLSVSTGNCNDPSLTKLIRFYVENKDVLDDKCKEMVILDSVYPEGIKKKLAYPQMKMLDMAFWQIGYDIDLEKTRQKKAEEKKKKLAEANNKN